MGVGVSAPFLSVIVTTHHRPQLLSRALEALRRQSFQEFEIILCADEGSEETRRVASEQLRDTDTFVSRPGTRGPAASRNLGVTRARGQYILFLDDDDSFEPAYFAALAARLQADPGPGVLYANLTVVLESRGPEGIVFREARRQANRNLDLRWLWVSNFLSNNSIAVATHLARRVTVDERLRSHEDWDYLLALLAITDFEHLDVFGPAVHVSANPAEHRNERAKRDRQIGLDFIAIYRKWPAPDERIRAARLEQLRTLGVSGDPAAI